jgi:hypothetical protein
MSQIELLHQEKTLEKKSHLNSIQTGHYKIFIFINVP